MVDPSFDYQATLAGCARNEAAALQRLYAQEAPCMLALANIMLNDQAAAQDAVHDSFVLIWKNAAGYDASMGDARAWIHSILRYRTRSLLLRQPKTGLSPAISASVVSSAADAGRLTSQLARQPESQRKPLLMAYYNGLSYAHIAQQLNRPVAEVRNNVRTSLRALQEFIPA